MVKYLKVIVPFLLFLSFFLFSNKPIFACAGEYTCHTYWPSGEIGVGDAGLICTCSVSGTAGCPAGSYGLWISVVFQVVVGVPVQGVDVGVLVGLRPLIQMLQDVT